MFENDDDKKFFEKELKGLEEKGAKRAAAFQAMVDHFFKSESGRKTEQGQRAARSEQENLQRQFLEQSGQKPCAKPNLQRSGFGQQAKGGSPGKNGKNTGLGELPEAGNTPCQEPFGSHAEAKQAAESVTKKFGFTSRLGRFR